jgi:hypothetical protein
MRTSQQAAIEITELAIVMTFSLVHTVHVEMVTGEDDICVLLFIPQAGDWESEGQQRLVSLTAQVTAQAAQLAAAEQRCKELLVS